MLSSLSQFCSRVIAVRCVSSTSVQRGRFTPRENSGVYRRLKAIKEDEADVFDKSEIRFEDLEALEEDFMQADRIQEDIERDIHSIRKKQDFKITERKHFKPPKEPNMLTWSEKEQIRYLRDSEPEKWTPITLAESFPASPDIIKKIVKNRWKPLSPERLIEHDQQVSKNWVAFHKGKLEVHNPRLKAHLTKFVDRKSGVQTTTYEEAKKVTEVILPKPKSTEFLSLITSFSQKNRENDAKTELKRLEENLQPVKRVSDKHKNEVKEMHAVNRLKSREPELISETVYQNEEAIRTRNSSETENNNSLPYVAPSERFVPNAMVYRKSKKSCLEVIDPDSLPNKIVIPKDQWVRGKLYRVNDCFYSDSGDFLYRVPGLKFS